MTPIRNRKKFFEYVQGGLQQYFDKHDKKFGGIIHFAVGVRQGQVRAIIRRDNPMPFAPKEHIGDGVYVEGSPPSNSPKGRARPTRRKDNNNS